MEPTKSNPLGIVNATGKVSGSPNMGQPMSSSYENRWLGDEKKSPLAHRKSLTTEESSSTPSTPSKKGKENPQQPAKKSQKEMTKAERRAIQEKQREEKAKRMTAQQPNKAGNNAKNDKSKAPAAPAAVVAKKKTVTKGQQNQAPWLLHLDAPKRPEATKDLHPAVVQLGLYFSEHKIVGSNARCVAMLEIFAKVIEDHKPPSDATFSRHIQKHLDPHIAYLLSVRPMSLSMRECIRWLKKEMADIVEEDPPLSDDDARSRLIEHIGHFIRERITMADQLIIQNGLQKIQNGDVILTYAKSSVVESLLLETKKKGIDFKVIVVDSRPLFEGKHLLRRLTAAGIDCSYHLLSSIYVALKSVTKVLMGAHALLNNGAVYSRIGSSMVAMAASDKQIPVMICCETYKFVNRTQVDSFVLNELGNPDDLVNTVNNKDEPVVLDQWRDQPDLRLLNILYDVTPSKYITLVVTEVGLIPCTSAPVIWREYNEEFGKRVA
ncbi:IF-2B-domain-containing protein [Backusella circina FSU 941]|nr:IF-2B-domain-containing protein [Backusella circina FSU 941]